MSTQVPNRFLLYHGEEYLLVSWESVGGCGLFRPDQFGIITEMLHTGCICGFICTYEIADEILHLALLKIRAKDGLYPLINDTPPTFPDGWSESHGGPAIYDDIGLRMAFTGTLQFGTDLDPKWHVNILGPEDWMYSRMYEAAVVDGHVRSVCDVSAKIAEIREQQPESKTTKAACKRRLKAMDDLNRMIDERT
jgi:hypothetical protein